MAEWQIEIKDLAQDFCVPKTVYREIIAHTKAHKNDTIPVSYHNNRNRYLYDMAHKELKKYLWKVLV